MVQKLLWHNHWAKVLGWNIRVWQICKKSGWSFVWRKMSGWSYILSHESINPIINKQIKSIIGLKTQNWRNRILQTRKVANYLKQLSSGYVKLSMTLSQKPFSQWLNRIPYKDYEWRLVSGWSAVKCKTLTAFDSWWRTAFNRICPQKWSRAVKSGLCVYAMPIRSNYGTQYPGQPY